MSKEGSEVAFIPDNISNISSGKQKFNEDTSQKNEDSYISKLTKFQNNHTDSEHGIDIVDIKAPSPQKFQLTEDADPKQIVEMIAKKLALENMKVEYVHSSIQRPAERKFILRKYSKQQIQLPSASIQIKRYHQEADNTYLQGKHTETDVISEKQSFVEQQHEISIQQSHQQTNHNVLNFDNIIHYDSIQQSEKANKKKHHSILKDKDYTDDLKETFYVTQVNRYDEFETELGWLEHCVQGNLKHLLRQTNQIIEYNQAVMIQIQKVQLRTKIIELEIETNKLKIALRKSPSSKHINFSVDLKFNRPTVLKIPKKIDANLRKYCNQLQQGLTGLRNMYESNQKELSLLDFYHKQFQQKVNYAYIYQQYLIQKAKKQLTNSMSMTNLKIKGSPKKIMATKTEDSLHLARSPNKKQKVLLRDSLRNSSSRQINPNSSRQIDRSVTSLANKLTNIEKIKFKKSTKNNLKIQENDHKDKAIAFIRNSKSTQNFIRQTSSEYYTEVLDKTRRIQKLDQSITKRVSLTHHKDLSLPSNKKFVQVTNGQIDKSFLPLFNTPNRQKKHFYYECQVYLKQLEKDYLCECESEKRHTLLVNKNGFRQRELLRMKTHQLKNQILDSEVDSVTKQKQITKENQILKRELQLLENQLFSKYHGQYDSESQKKMRKTIRSPNKLKNLLPNEYDLLYKQAERRLQTYKSTTMLQNLRPNIPKSPKKINSQQSLQNITSLENIPFEKNHVQSKHGFSQRPDTKIVKKETKKGSRKMSKSPVLVRLKSSQKSKRLLNRFKTGISQDFMSLTMKKPSPVTSPSKKANPQTTVGTLRPNAASMSIPQMDFVEEEYYAV